MCDRLKTVREALKNQPAAFALRDIIQVICSNCERQDVCSAVSSDEYDRRQQLKEFHFAD